MDWNRLAGHWKQFKGAAKEKWGKLTDDDLNVIEGRREQLEGKLQQRYGYAKDQVRKDVDDWFNTLNGSARREKAPVHAPGLFLCLRRGSNRSHDHPEQRQHTEDDDDDPA